MLLVLLGLRFDATSLGANEPLLDRAEELMKSERPREAIALLTEMLADNSITDDQRFEAMAARSSVYLSLSEYEAALTDADLLVTDYDDRAEAYLLTGQILLVADQSADALLDLNTAIELANF